MLSNRVKFPVAEDGLDGDRTYSSHPIAGLSVLRTRDYDER